MDPAAAAAVCAIWRRGIGRHCMPYLIFSANGDEIDRRELSEPVIIGRAPDCTICIRDILLSRKHCAG